MMFTLFYRDGLYYCASNVYTADTNPVHVQCSRAALTKPTNCDRAASRPGKFAPTTRAWQIKSEVWALQLGSPDEHQLNVIQRHDEFRQMSTAIRCPHPEERPLFFP
jgi:hypothetical protein